MDVYICFMWSYTLTPPLFSTMVSHWQTTTLAFPYDNHVMYAFTYADIPPLSENYDAILMVMYNYIYG